MASQGDLLNAAKARNMAASRDRSGAFRTAFGGSNAQDATDTGFRDSYAMMSIQSSGTTQHHFNDPRYMGSGMESGSGVSGIENPLARDVNYDAYDNDANFDSTLNSVDDPEAYVHNRSWSQQELDDRWKQGGGVDSGEAKGIHAGRNRDIDGTVDRVKDPPKDLLPLLYAVKMMCSSYNIDLHGIFHDAGGTAFGIISPTKFVSALTVGLHRMPISEALLFRILTVYGCGDPAPANSAQAKIAPFDAVAWHDFVEDVGNAVDVSDKPFTYPGGPPPLHR